MEKTIAKAAATLTWSIVTRRGERTILTMEGFLPVRQSVADIWPGCRLNYVHATGDYVVEWNGIAVADVRHREEEC